MAKELIIKEDKLADSGNVKHKIKKVIVSVLLYAPLIFWSIVTIFPFYYMLLISTKSSSQIYTYPPVMTFMADSIQNVIDNYNNLQSAIPFWTNMWNSAYIAIMSTLTTILLCSLGGFGFGLYEFKGKKVLFRIMLFTIMIPGILNIIPYFTLMSFFGWVNRPIALWLPSAANAFGFFLMKQYVESSVPKDLVDAARIDGSSEIGIFFRVVLPLVRPMMGSLGIITFIGSWNNYFAPLIILTQKETMTIPVALNTLRGFASVDWGAVMLGASISVFPMAIIFLIFSRWIISGMTEGSLAN